ncbi:MAG: response regulator [Candidatus Rokubacteria bacterium]|nr:response regulator [Candidatus Rokubacteria bacterium]
MVLVIDDDPELARCFQLFLQRGGFRTASSDTADDGLEGIRRLRPALVIVDLWLRVPEGGSLRSGMDLIGAMAKESGLRDVPVMVVTGDAPPAPELRHAGVEFVSKADAAADPGYLPALVRQRLARPQGG